jgi:hypothetical protein
MATPALRRESPPRDLAEASDEELAIYALLRIVLQNSGPVTLSPVPRAFVAGAKEVFRNLYETCDSMLNRKFADFMSTRADPTEKPVSTGSGVHAPASGITREAREAVHSAPSAAQLASASTGTSLVDRLARLEAGFDQLAKFTGQRSRTDAS